MIRVMLVAQPALFRECLHRLLCDTPNIEVVADAGSGEEALKAARVALPAVCIVDPGVPNGGPELLKGLSTRVDGGVVLLTNSLTPTLITRFLELGVRGILKLDCALSELVSAVERVSEGDLLIKGSFASTALHGLIQSNQGNRGLTPRERDIIRLVAEGRKNHEIASELTIAENTVKGHLANVFSKLELDNRVQLTTFAIENGLLDQAC